MTDYTAPIQDMTFVLNELSGLPEVIARTECQDASPDLVNAILEEAGKLASEVIAPLNRSGDQTGLTLTEQHDVIAPDGFKQAWQAYAEGGWGSLQFDPEYGGQGLPFALAIPVQEMWHAANMSWGLCPLLTQGAVEAISVNASESLKARYLPGLISGQWSGTMNLTEPQAGSDLAAITAKAVPEGDHYRISGQKIFITWGEHSMAENIIHLVLARLPDAPAGVKGISLFLVPKFLLNDDGSPGKRNDCRAISLEHKLGIHASPTCVMSYGDNDGAIGYLIGEEHRGLACMFTMMNNARLTVGLQGVSVADRAYQQARLYARDRVQGVTPGLKTPGPIIYHPDVRRMLMTMRSLTEAARALAYLGCREVDMAEASQLTDGEKMRHKRRQALLTPLVKAWCTEIAQEVTSLNVQIHGGMGFIEETGAAQLYRDARILPIYEGTNGIQAMDLIGRKLVFDKGLGLSELLDDVDASLAEMHSSDQVSAAQLKRVNDSVLTLRTCSRILLNCEDSSIQNALAMDYLMMMSYVITGWQMLKAADIAGRHLTENPESDFYQAKIRTCRFYLDQVLPRYLTHAEIINNGANSTLEMDIALF